MLEKRHSAQYKGELCGDVLTLGVWSETRTASVGVRLNLETLHIEFVATINLQLTLRINPSWRNSVGTFGVMLLILEVDVAMRQRGLVTKNEATEFGLVAWQKYISLLIKDEDGQCPI